MDWNSKGLGQIKTEVVENKIIFNETIELDDEFGNTELKDKKMWVFYDDKIYFLITPISEMGVIKKYLHF
jgi:hypothetical protein